jgi:hypothetical protein
MRAVRSQLHSEGLPPATLDVRVRQRTAVSVPLLSAEVQTEGPPDQAHHEGPQRQNRDTGGEQPRSKNNQKRTELQVVKGTLARRKPLPNTCVVPVEEKISKS